MTEQEPTPRPRRRIDFGWIQIGVGLAYLPLALMLNGRDRAIAPGRLVVWVVTAIVLTGLGVAFPRRANWDHASR